MIGAFEFPYYYGIPGWKNVCSLNLVVGYIFVAGYNPLEVYTLIAVNNHAQMRHRTKLER